VKQSEQTAASQQTEVPQQRVETTRKQGVTWVDASVTSLGAKISFATYLLGLITYLTLNSTVGLLVVGFGSLNHLLRLTGKANFGSWVAKQFKKRNRLETKNYGEPEQAVRFAQGCGFIVSSIVVGAGLVGSVNTVVVLLSVMLLLSYLQGYRNFCVGCQLWSILGRVRK